MSNNRPISAQTAIQLYQSTRTLSPAVTTSSSDELTCRMCRCGGTSRNLLVRCPCDCKGSIGMIHRQCWNAWKKVQRKNVCEICNCEIDFGDDKTNNELFYTRFKRLFKPDHLGFVVHRCMCVSSIWPLVRISLHLFEQLMHNYTAERTAQSFMLSVSAFFFYAFLTLYSAWIVQSGFEFKDKLVDWWMDIDDETDIENDSDDATDDGSNNDVD